MCKEKEREREREREREDESPELSHAFVDKWITLLVEIHTCM